MWDRIVNWWDWKVYWIGWRTMSRMCVRNPGFAYLFKLHIDSWLERNPLPPELRRATEEFHKSFPDKR